MDNCIWADVPMVEFDVKPKQAANERVSRLFFGFIVACRAVSCSSRWLRAGRRVCPAPRCAPRG